MKVDTAVKETGEKLVKKINPTGKLLKLKKELEYADTIVNRQALAKEYLSLGAYDDAVTLYESCLEPPYEDDPEMIFDLATALYLNKSYDEAKEQLLRLKEINLGLRQKDAYLMLAKTYEQLGEVDNALAEYKSLVPVYPGEEARCRYALLLKKNGKPKAAKKMFNEIILGANRSPRYYKRNQRKWINMAKENLREPQQ